jgi:hypothetical protein
VGKSRKAKMTKQQLEEEHINGLFAIIKEGMIPLPTPIPSSPVFLFLCLPFLLSSTLPYI